LQETALSEATKKRQAAVIDVNAKLFDKGQSYSNIIILAGYAGAFAIWTNTKSSLPAKANIAIAALLGLSLCVFVLFEIYNMFRRHNVSNRYAKLLNVTSDKEFFENFQTYMDAEHASLSRLMPAWRIALVFTIVPALMAVALLFYNYFAILIGWPPWPS
jgi:4-amino-4-deoxy-L-arabinose transferase-like glycosyltransferase